jgi:hypothetical protein
MVGRWDVALVEHRRGEGRLFCTSRNPCLTTRPSTAAACAPPILNRAFSHIHGRGEWARRAVVARAR